ncbi:holin, partial [Enterococcus faecalis]|nr:holin [Enterococcus faecalis]
MALFDFLERFVADPDYKAVYVLMLICIAMTIDFISGTIAAKINPEIEFKSKIG